MIIPIDDSEIEDFVLVCSNPHCNHKKELTPQLFIYLCKRFIYNFEKINEFKTFIFNDDVLNKFVCTKCNTRKPKIERITTGVTKVSRVSSYTKTQNKINISSGYLKYSCGEKLND